MKNSITSYRRFPKYGSLILGVTILLILLTRVVDWHYPTIAISILLVVYGTYAFIQYNAFLNKINSEFNPYPQFKLFSFNSFIRFLNVEKETQHELNQLVLTILENKKIEVNNEQLLKNPIYQSILRLEEEFKLQKKIIADQKWIQEGESTISEILRNHMESSMEVSYKEFLSGLITFMKAYQGAVYRVEEDENEEKVLVRKASYALSNENNHIVQWGQGILGKIITQKNIHIEHNIPNGYLTVNSGLGESKASTLVFIPIYHNELPIAILELAFFRKLTGLEKEFLSKLSELSGVILENKNNTEKTKSLLTITEKTAALLKENESEMKRNEQALILAKEELDARLIELKAESNLTSCIVNAINKSNASLELDLYGNILHANKMFLSVMGFDLAEIQGKNEAFMLEPDEAESEKYQLMWNSLANGNFIAGEFIRISSTGKKIWLEATYNPIIDLEGKPYKIIMYATFTTEMKEKENDYLNKISLLNETGAFLELSPEGNIKNSNQKFLDILNVKRKDIRGVPFKTLIEMKENTINGSKVFLQDFPFNESVRGHLCLKGSDLTLYKFNTILMPTKDLSNSIKGYLVLLNPLDNTK